MNTYLKMIQILENKKKIQQERAAAAAVSSNSSRAEPTSTSAPAAASLAGSGSIPSHYLASEYRFDAAPRSYESPNESPITDSDSDFDEAIGVESRPLGPDSDKEDDDEDREDEIKVD